VKFIYGACTEDVWRKYGASPCQDKSVKKDEIG